MPFSEGDETCDTLVDAVVVLGEDSMWCVGSRFSMPLMGGSGRNDELPACAKADCSMLLEPTWSARLAFTRSVAETGGSCMDMAMGSARAMSGGYMGMADDMWDGWAGDVSWSGRVEFIVGGKAATSAD